MSPLNRCSLRKCGRRADARRRIGGTTLVAAEEAGWPKMPPVKIHVVYVGLGGAGPNRSSTPQAKSRSSHRISGPSDRLGDVEFVGGELIPNRNEAAATGAKLGPTAYLFIGLRVR